MPEEAGRLVDIAAWVEQARDRPLEHLSRQATEIILTAIALKPGLNDRLLLKGGTLMSLVYGSPRRTVDIDLTSASAFAVGVEEEISQELNDSMAVAAARLGYATLECRVQTAKRRPNPARVPDPRFPALLMTIAFAQRDTAAHASLKAGRCAQVMDLDISYNEPVWGTVIVELASSGKTIRAYSQIDLMAEKLRAYLQQERRRRARRQDLYDLALLIETAPPSQAQRQQVPKALIEKRRARDLEPDADSIARPELQRRARSDWKTLDQELDEVPAFEDCFATVEAFYRSLPWD